MDRNDEMMNLEELKSLLNDVPDDGGFDLDSIIAEVSGKTYEAPKAASAPRRAELQQPEMPEQYAKPESPRAAAPKRRAVPDTPREQAAAPESMEEELDPREARIAAREAKAAAKREKAEMKAAAKTARRAAKQQDEETAPEEKRAPRAEKMTRKQARAARRAAEQEEEEADIELLDPTQAARTLKRVSRSLSVRSVLVLLLAAAAAYLSIAPNFDALPLPIVLDAVENPTIGVGALMVLQIAAALLGMDVFGAGFAKLLHGTPDRASLVSFAVLAALLHGASIIVFENEAGVTIPYLAVSILLLYAAMREKRNCCAARGRAYQVVGSVERPMAIYSHYDREDDVCRALKGPLHTGKAFLIEMERPDTADRFSMVYVPVALAAAIIFALLSSVGCGQPVRFFWAFSALLSVCAPLGLLCAFGASYKNVSSRLLGLGAAISGARQANLLRGTEEVVISEHDLFPAGSISIGSLQNMGQVTDDKLLGCAAALTDAAGLELGRVLTATVRERYGVTLTARNVQAIEGGLTGEVGNSRVLIGTAALMVKMGVRIHSGQGDQVGLYLVLDNVLSGILSLRYQPTKQTYQAMRLVRRMRMSVGLAVQDFNISPAMVESQFDLRRGYVNQLDQATIERLLDPAYTQEDAPAAILSHDGAGQFVQVLRCADKLAGAVRSSLTLGAFAGICGMLIVFYLVFINAVAALPVQHLLLYLLIWYIPVFITTQQTR